jgi:hypothetical protein
MYDRNPIKTRMIKQLSSKPHSRFFGENPNHRLPTACRQMACSLIDKIPGQLWLENLRQGSRGPASAGYKKYLFHHHRTSRLRT